MARKTLSGCSIVLTREREANAELAAMLHEAGAHVEICPLIRIVPPEDDAAIRKATRSLNDYRWIVLTSSNAVRPWLAGCSARVACVGEATARAARKAGARVALVSAVASAAGLMNKLAPEISAGDRVLWPRGELAPMAIKDGLRKLGAVVDDPIAYRNLPDAEGAREMCRLIRAGGVQAVAFASASAVNVAAGACADALSSVHVYVIGPATAGAAAKAGLKIHGQAADASARGLAEAILAGESRGE